MKFAYEPATVEIYGIIRPHTFPGLPNYENVAAGDEPENCWLLHLLTPITVSANGLKEYPINNETETNVTELQLVFMGDGDYPQYRKFVSQRVKVVGMLFHQFTGHHHTPVLITVQKIEGLK